MTTTKERRSSDPKTITYSQERPSTSQALTTTMSKEDRARLVMMLTALAAHFWRPDLTPAQDARRYADYAEDLGGCTIAEIEVAIREYRLKPKIPGKMKPFPGSDDLLELVIANRKHRAEVERLGNAVHVDSRPLCWWTRPMDQWKPHWREEDIPEAARDVYYKLKAMRAAGTAPAIQPAPAATGEPLDQLHEALQSRDPQAVEKLRRAKAGQDA